MTGIEDACVLRARGLRKQYGKEAGLVRAVDGIDLDVAAGQTPRQARRRARQLLEQVGLGERASHLPSALSGGQRQRVAIARALVNEPAVILTDEPTGNLDSAATLEVLRLFGALRADGLTLVVVTHDERVAAMADRLISMRDGVFAEDTAMASTGGPDVHFPAGLNG